MNGTLTTMGLIPPPPRDALHQANHHVMMVSYILLNYGLNGENDSTYLLQTLTAYFTKSY